MSQSNELIADDFPRSGRLIGVDFGTVRIGISVCDPMWILASPLEIRAVGGKESDAAYFQSLIRREQAVGLIVGLPIHCDGGESEKSREARAFAVWLTDVTSLPVRLFDERFTSSVAQQRIRETGKKGKHNRDRNLDAVAAQVLLESFMEAIRYGGGQTPGQMTTAPATGDASLE